MIKKRIIQTDKNLVLGYGADGTTIYQGQFQGRIVAVKKITHINQKYAN